MDEYSSLGGNYYRKEGKLNFLSQSLANIWPSIYRVTDTIFWSLINAIKGFITLAIKQIMGKYD